MEERLKNIQRRLEVVDSLSLRRIKKELQEGYNIVLAQEELLWFQKSREKWVRYGDQNTKFFHIQTIMRQKRNKIHGLFLKDGIWSVDPLALQEEALNLYKRLFSVEGMVDLIAMGEIPVPRLSQEGCVSLQLFPKRKLNMRLWA